MTYYNDSDMGSEVFASRIGQLREIMKSKGLDAVIITGSDPHSSEYPALRWKQVEWLCGFTGEAGDVVVTQDHAGLWTDSRYFIQAAQQLEGTGVELHKTRIPGEVRIPQWLAEIAFADRRRGVTVAVDGLAMSISAVEDIRNAFVGAERHYDEDTEAENGFKIIDIPDMLDAVRVDRPAVPSSPLITLGEDLTGESRQSKIVWLRDFVADNDCDAILVTALDEIAWLLNIRASDIEYNPVALSYLLVTADSILLYIRKGPGTCADTETAASYAELETDGVTICGYDDVFVDILQQAGEDYRTVHIDPSTLNYHIYKLLSSLGDKVDIVCGKSPIPLRKSVKNAVEIAGMREAHIEDGIAMEKFLFWLDDCMASGADIDEWDAAKKIDSLRAEIPGYRGNSFQTISAYGPGAALPHYVTPAQNSGRLEPHGLYLCDSGGQYLYGTTDITRTVPLGPCTEQEMEDYTLVLKGHIGLASAVFPAGTSGCQIDYAARTPLWKNLRDYGHGTGHGVGFYLNVHEGPQDIRHNFTSQPLLPGMITSDEPGLYREGLHGVRHESLLLCSELCTNEFGSWLCFENLTLCHIDTAPVLRDLLTDEEALWLNNYNEYVYQMLSPRLPEDESIWLYSKTRPI